LYVYIMSNSAYADQRVYGGAIANISNSPFTDERRQGGGGGVPGDGTGNVQYDIANKTLNTRLAGVNTIIQDIDQGASGFVIGNDVGSLNFDATDAGVKLTSSLADVTVKAEEIAKTQGIKGAKIEAGFDLNTGLYENTIDMTLDSAEAKIEIKSEGTDAENTIRLTTKSSAPTQAGSANLSLLSTVSPLVSDRIVMAIGGVVDNPPTNSPAWFTVVGETIAQQFRSFDLFSNQVRFRNFLTMSFAGGTVNPIYEFKPDQFYRFNNDPTDSGQALTVAGGAGEDDNPWLMEWITPSGGGGGLGNVIYDGSRLNVDNGTGSTVITNIDYTNAPLTIKNDGGALIFNAVTDSTTVRGDNLLELRSIDGTVQIDAETDANINAITGDVKIQSNNNVEISIPNEYNCKNSSSTIGTMYSWTNEITAGTILGEFRFARDTGDREIIICDLIDTFSFAGNSSASQQRPSIKFSQIGTDGCFVTFLNRPQNDGDVLTYNGNGDGAAVSPRELEWKAPASGSGDVTFDNDPSLTDGESFKADGITISNFFIGPSGPNLTSTQRSSINRSNGTLLIKSETFGEFDQARIILETDRINDGNNDKTAITIQSFLGGVGSTGRDFVEILVGATAITPIADILNPNFPTTLFPYFAVIESYLGNLTEKKREETFQINQTRVCKRYENFAYHIYAFGQKTGTISNNSQPIYGLNYRGGGGNNQYDTLLYRYTNVPTLNSVLTCVGGDGSLTTPFNLEFSSGGGGGGTANANLELNYDTTTSTLILSDPADNLPAISTTQIVPGRTVLIKDVIVNGTTELSALGLSNSIFPPPLSGQTGYWDGLIGNSPPRVSLNPVSGLTNWFPGASFKISLAGEITKIGGYDDIILKVYSNRGQLSQNILNNFSMITRSVNPPPKLGWNWVIDFTCRSVNDGNTLGVIATSSSFNYTDDSYTLETYGAIVSNTNSSFDTSVEQYLDCTIEFDYYNQSNNIKTTLCTIERIF
jgi:hypothetical protein